MADGTVLGEDGLTNLRYIKIAESGYSGEGDKFDDGAVGRVTHIAITYEDEIRSIQTTYERGGAAVMSRRHGGDKGNFVMIDLHEPLTCVSGHYRPICWDDEEALFNSSVDDNDWLYHRIITSLTFQTKRETYGPFGTSERGTPFSFKTGCADICGFHGRCSSDYLHALGGYVRCPATRFLDESPNSDVKIKNSDVKIKSEY